MNLSFRSKLLALVATAGFALALLVLSSAIIAGRVERNLDDIRQRYLPKVGLRPQLSAQLERIQRGFQDAVYMLGWGITSMADTWENDYFDGRFRHRFRRGSHRRDCRWACRSSAAPKGILRCCSSLMPSRA